MLENQYKTCQITLLENMLPEELEPGEFIAWGTSILTGLRKAKSYLRKDKEHKHWERIKETSLDQLVNMSRVIPGLLADPLLEERHRQKLFDFSSKVTQVLYEEDRLDKSDDGKPKIEMSVSVNEEHFDAFARLMNNDN